MRLAGDKGVDRDRHDARHPLVLIARHHASGGG
jgi:hypothetical protein